MQDRVAKITLYVTVGTAAGSILCAAIYLRRSGCRPGWYEKCLLGLSVAIALGFARADDGFVKFVMVLFLFAGDNLGLCLMAGQNRCPPASPPPCWMR